MKIARVLGIDVILDFSTLILAFIIGHSSFERFSRIFPNESTSNLLSSSSIVCIGILLSILLHEFGHATVGRLNGIGFDKIILHVLGGAAVMNSAIESPKAEFRMAIAGPLVSIFLGFTLLLLLPLTLNGDQPTLSTLTIFNLCATNIILGIFNMIPAFPLDGGRVLRSILWQYNKDFIKSTKISVEIGRGFGIALVCCGFLMSMGIEVPLFGVGLGSGVWTSVMGVFIILAGTQELKAIKNKADVVERNTRES